MHAIRKSKWSSIHTWINTGFLKRRLSSSSSSHSISSLPSLFRRRSSSDSSEPSEPSLSDLVREMDGLLSIPDIEILYEEVLIEIEYAKDSAQSCRQVYLACDREDFEIALKNFLDKVKETTCDSSMAAREQIITAMKDTEEDLRSRLDMAISA